MRLNEIKSKMTNYICSFLRGVITQPVNQSFDGIFVVRLDKFLNKQVSDFRYKTP